MLIWFTELRSFVNRAIHSIKIMMQIASLAIESVEAAVCRFDILTDKYSVQSSAV